MKQTALSSLLEAYRTYLLLEKGLSEHTRQAYEQDLAKLLDYLATEGKPVLEVKLEDLHRFAASLYDLGISLTSIARIISGIRSFYRFLLEDGYLEADPTELLETPEETGTLARSVEYGGSRPLGELHRLVTGRGAA